MHPFFRRSVQTVIITGGLAAIALELAGGRRRTRHGGRRRRSGARRARPLRWPTGRGPSVADGGADAAHRHPGVVSPLRTLCPCPSTPAPTTTPASALPPRPGDEVVGPPGEDTRGSHPGGRPRRVRRAGLRRCEHPVGGASRGRGPRLWSGTTSGTSPTCSPPGSCRAASTRRSWWHGIAAGGVDGLGERLLTAVLGIWEADGGVALRVAFAGLTSGEVQAEALAGYVGREVFAQVAQLLPPPDQQLRVSLVASQVAGVLLARHVAAARAAGVDARRGRRRPRRSRRSHRYLTGRRSRHLPCRGDRHRPGDQRDLQRQPRPRDDGLPGPRRARPAGTARPSSRCPGRRRPAGRPTPTRRAVASAGTTSAAAHASSATPLPSTHGSGSPRRARDERPEDAAVGAGAARPTCPAGRRARGPGRAGGGSR